MALNYGPGVSRTLDPVSRAFQNVVFQKGKPPLDSEFCLQDSIHNEQMRQQIASMMPSGFVFDPTRTNEYYGFNPLFSNQFNFGQTDPSQNDQPSIVAVVNGMVVQVAGTDIAASVNNVIKLYPAPTSNARIDLVFLEVWQALVAPNPSTQNKPSASTIWKYGNTKFGGTNLPDDLQDPTLGFETTKRVQTQYRIRVFGNGVGGVDLSTYPDGLDDPHVVGQGSATNPVAGLTFTNMGKELGDPSLWRAGNGNPANALGTVDGYVYSIPICAVFRRNSSTFVAINNAGAANQNGGYNRRPTTNTLANPLSGAALLAVPTLVSTMLPTDLPTTMVPLTVQVTNLIGSGIDDPLHYASGGSVFITVGSEIMQVTGFNTSVVPNTITIATATGALPYGGRGRYKTQITRHEAGSALAFYNVRPDGLFADEVAASDVLDLRRSVNPGAWDYNQLLTHNLAALMRNRLHSTWKQSLNGTSQGPVVTEVDYMYANGAGVPTNALQVDGPDGIRTIFSDAAVVQRDVTMLLNNSPTLTNGYTSTQFDTNMVWDVGASFVPDGFINNEGATGYWTNGSVIFVHVEGSTGYDGAKASFKWSQGPIAPPAIPSTVEAVRFLTPREYWRGGTPQSDLTNGDQFPVKLRFIGDATTGIVPFCLSQQPVTVGESSIDPDANAKHPGPLYPWQPLNFMFPFVTLGDVLNNTMVVNGLAASSALDSSRYANEGIVEIDVGINFDTPNLYWTYDSKGNYEVIVSPSLANPLLNGERTLFDLLTAGGTQRTGVTSDVILVLTGDSAAGSRPNNGAFLVVGAGTTVGKSAATSGDISANFTQFDASSSTRVVCIPLNADFPSGGFNTTTGGSLNGQFRSQVSTVEGGTGTAGQSAMCVVLTDIGGKNRHPWNRVTLGSTQSVPYFNFSADYSTYAGYAAIKAKAVLSMALQYSPSRGAQTHVPDVLTRFALRAPTADYLRQPRSADDSTFPTLTGAPADSGFNPASIQLWNRLPAHGWDAGAVNPNTGLATGISYGGLVVANTEQDRENELFVDLGSKTVIFRPFRERNMTLQAVTVPHSSLIAGAAPSLIGDYNYPMATTGGPKDGLSLFTQGGNLAPYNAGAASGGKNLAFAVPPEYMPRFGRQDIPYYVDVATPKGSGTFLEGINHLFLDTTDPTQGQTAIMGGYDNAGPGNGIYSLWFRAAPTTFPAAKYGSNGTNISGGAPALTRPYYVARRGPVDINSVTTEGKAVIQKFNQVTSSDLGGGLKGIQLPPYLGISRLYGVYEYSNYVAGGGATWSPDRATYIGTAQPTPIQNLLRKDADAQSLFIMQDGALDLTLETGDHTYIVPANVIDLTKIPGYVAGVKDKFEDFEFIVECTVFGFAKNWINGNDYVLCRHHDGEATAYADGSQIPANTNPQIQNVQMVIPAPAHANAAAYSVIDRTVYQGDPYGTRNGVTATVTDYLHRYGSVPLGDAALLAEPIQQYDTNGNFLPVVYNPRAFEVLSSIDFYTTMGTGKVGGRLYSGTPLDIGYLQDTPDVATRVPPTSTSYAFRNTFDRAFTEGQKDSPNRAALLLNLLDATPYSTDPTTAESVNGAIVVATSVEGLQGQVRMLTSPIEYRLWIEKAVGGLGITTVTTVREHGLSQGDHVAFIGTGTGLDGTHTIANVPSLRTFTFAGAVTTTPTATSSGQVALGGHQGDSVSPVASRQGARLLQAVARVPAVGSITVSSPVDIAVTVIGARIGDGVLVNGQSNSPRLVITAFVSSADTVTVRLANPSAAALSFSEQNLYLTVTPQEIDIQTTLLGLANSLNNAQQSVFASPFKYGQLLLQSTVAGAEGNLNHIRVGNQTLGLGVVSVSPASPMVLTFAGELSLLGEHFDPVVGHTNSVFMSGFTGTDATNFNGRYWQVTVLTPTTVSVVYDNTGGLKVVVAPTDTPFMRPALVGKGGGGSLPLTGIIASLERIVLTSPSDNQWISKDIVCTSSNLIGGVDVPVNAGNGNSQLSLTGMTERLPLGLLLSDSDFLSENPLNDSASAVQTFPSALRPIQKLLPLSTRGREYERFLGAAGDLVAQGDGSILTYAAYNAITTPAGTRAYRMYRGGGSLYVLDGLTPGGPVDWATTSFPPAIRPVLKGGVLVGKAMLVRSFPETAFTDTRTNAYGDEIQMLVVTNGVFGTTMATVDGLTLQGSIGSAGYGEGYAASDRYRIDGKPMFRDTSFRHVDPATVQPTPYIKGFE